MGKTEILRRCLYLLWRRYQAGEDVGRPYVIGPGWKPPPGGFSGGFSERTNLAKATAFMAAYEYLDPRD